jgi:hypothetical protein
MKPPSSAIDSALLDVRKAYRLLHDYQRMVLDAVTYLGNQLGLTYAGGWPKFSAATPRRGGGKLDNWAWDWLNMMEYDFHFTRDLAGGKTLSLSMLLISDTGYFCSHQKSPQQTETADFLPPEESQTKIGFVISATDWKPEFMEDREAMKIFIETGGELPDAFRWKGIVTRCYDLARLMSEESTNALIDELISAAKKAGVALERIPK